MSKQIFMPVECIDEFCKDCRELEIEIEGRYLTDGVANCAHFNRIYCKHFPKCETLEKRIRKNWEESHRE